MHRIIRWQHHSVERLTGSVGSGGKTPTVYSVQRQVSACSHLSSGSTGSQQFFWQAVCHGAATAMIVPQSQFCIYLRWSEKTSWFSGRINDRITIFVIWGKVKEHSLWTGNKLAFFIRSHRDWISLIAISQCYIVTFFLLLKKIESDLLTTISTVALLTFFFFNPFDCYYCHPDCSGQSLQWISINVALMSTETCL